MKKRNTLTLILLFAALTLAAQSNYSPCYTNNMSKGNTAFSQGKYNEARTYYSNARQCAGGNSTEAQSKINACDAKIKAQKEETEKQKAEAEAAEARRKAEMEDAILKARVVEEITVSGIAFKMIYVHGGTFTMGCTSEQGGDCYGSEKPFHSVAVENFWMGETEVTQALWKAVMGKEHNGEWGGWENLYGRGSAYPAYRVSWNDCQKFIQRLNQLTGKTFRLPTEAEWEYAARGGNKSRGFMYAGSNTIDDVAWYVYNGGDETHPAKTKFPNELGLYDMSGNVWEWCQDWYSDDYYSVSPSKTPQGPSSGSYRVLRGGGWDCPDRGCRVSIRIPNGPDYSCKYYGFRLVLIP